MAAMNKVLLVGNVTRDPEIQRTPSGSSVLDLGVAVSENYKGKDGQVVQSTCFTDVVVWGRQAESCAQYLAKGSPVMVEGRLQLDQWKTEAGENRSKLKIHAQRIQFLGRGRREEPEPVEQEGKRPFARPERSAPARAAGR
ncbi:MAG: single-stranded DNA-binding protein [Verrucomicrobia bacterium]|nr:single-stranded DNA-binding protein [Verrucomicrobiota bacterium]MBU1909676.1 single-stranded DNA-binding protein [Verrucomicrobiota bacterium]